MSEKKNARLKYVVEHSNLLSPEEYLRFIHLHGFTSDWAGIKLDDIDLQILQIQIMLSPDKGAVISGTGGLRKLRFSPPLWNQGKSGAVRVLYAIFPEHSVAVLAAAFRKSEMENIHPGDKRMLKQIIEEIAYSLGEKSKS